jgi:D-hydroxyproline dehydrogenase subunit gamma
MPEIVINGKHIVVAPGVTVAAAVLSSGEAAFRRSVQGEPRGPLCGMGICYECRVTIDGELHARSCQILCRDGMVIETACIS